MGTSAPAAKKEGSAAQRQIERAQRLEGQRADLLDEVAANRQYLRLMDKNGELEGETATVDGKNVPAGDWLDDFYPEKEKDVKRNEDEIERTRKVREDARKRFRSK